MADTNKSDSGEIVWERDLIEKLALESVKEQRRKRRWSIFFRFLLFGYLFLLLYMAMNGNMSTDNLNVGDHTALIAIDDVIMPRDKGISADQVAKGLKNAYKNKSTKGIILQINSPGGSPVQSARIYAEIRRLRKEHKDIPVYAVIGDVGASGAYYVAAAADKIYANESSIVGSIGVRMGEFGFVDAWTPFCRSKMMTGRMRRRCCRKCTSSLSRLCVTGGGTASRRVKRSLVDSSGAARRRKILV